MPLPNIFFYFVFIGKIPIFAVANGFRVLSGLHIFLTFSNYGTTLSNTGRF